MTSSPLAVTIDAAAPVATDDTATTVQDTAINIDVLANDSDADGEALSISGTPTASHGAVTVNQDGTLHYAPNAGYTGSDTITYVVTDGVLSDTGKVSLTVDPPPNTPPVAADDSYTATAGTPLMVTAANGVLANDSDANGDALSAVLVNGPSHGSLSLNGDGSFSYTATDGYSGADRLPTRSTTGPTTSPVATVSLTVDPPPNDAPVSHNDSYSGTRGTTLSVNASQGVLANDTDANGDILSAILVSGPSSRQGSLTLHADGSFEFTPTGSFTGTTSFQYVASDGEDSSQVATVTLSIGGGTTSHWAAVAAAAAATAAAYDTTTTTTTTTRRRRPAPPRATAAVTAARAPQAQPTTQAPALLTQAPAPLTPAPASAVMVEAASASRRNSRPFRT